MCYGLMYISGGTGLVFPACVVNGAAVSKTFQILYRNEEVHLDDHVLFKLHLIVDAHKVGKRPDGVNRSLIFIRSETGEGKRNKD